MAPTRLHELAARNAETRPDAPALRDGDGAVLTWGALDAAIGEAAEILRARGVRPGDRVLIVSENAPALVAFFLASALLDAWAVPVNARLVAAELARIRADATPRVEIYVAATSADAARHAESVGALPVETACGTVAIAQNADVEPEPVDVGADQVACLLYTTGTTGRPKGVMLTHGNLLFAGNASAQMRRMHAGDVIYGVLPITHVFGLASMLSAAASVGAELRLVPRFRPEHVLAALHEGVTILPAVPQMHALLVSHARAIGEERLTQSDLRFVSSGGAPLDPELKRRAEAFYGLPLQNGYGMTETSAGVTATRSPLGSGDVSVGLAFPGVEVALDVADGTGDGVGEILTRGPHVMRGYYRNAEETARVMRADRLLRTGDLGRMDEEGRLHVVGRSKELIIRSGFNVYPVEVEAALVEHPKVIQAAVVGRRLEGGNEEVVAFVLVAPGTVLDAAELEAHVEPRLAPYKRPSAYVIETELPATATGKILKHALATRLNEV